MVRSRNPQLLMIGGCERKNKMLCLGLLTAGFWVTAGPRATADFSCCWFLLREKQPRLGGVVIFHIVYKGSVAVMETNIVKRMNLKSYFSLEPVVTLTSSSYGQKNPFLMCFSLTCLSNVANDKTLMTFPVSPTTFPASSGRRPITALPQNEISASD